MTSPAVSILRSCLAAIALGAVFCSAAAAREETPTGPLVQEIVVDGPLRAVWDVFTTKEGLESWMVPKASVDCRVGGTIRSTYDPAGSLDGPASIELEYLTLLPYRMISLRTSKSPAGSPFRDAIAGTWSVFEFEELSADRVRVRVTGLGYDANPEARRARTFFESANVTALESLRKALDRGVAAKQANVLRLMQNLVGGEWIHESKMPGGGLFRVRNVSRLAPDGRSVLTEGWNGGAKGVHYHASTQAWQDPASGVVRFQSICEDGSVAAGALTWIDEHTVGWDWRATHAGGRVEIYWIEMEFDPSDADRYQMRMHGGTDAKAPLLVDLAFRRVDEAPAGFRPQAKSEDR